MSAPLTDERIGVLGLARSGLAAARLALTRGAWVYASDAGDGAALREAAERVRALGGEAHTGGHDLALLAGCDRVVLSPGIPPSAPVIGQVEQRGVPIIAELEFAFGQLDAPVVAVTGTNGKTTVTSMTAHVLQASGLRAAEGGNIGTALSEVALLDPAPEVAVVEASSFQLARVSEFAPRVGVLTNLAPDHLDWYPGVAEYFADKANMFRNATPASHWVLNGEDAQARALPGDAPGRRYFFYAAGRPADGERGGWVDEQGWLVLRLEPDAAAERLLESDQLQVLGPHNRANALAAALAARLVGAPAEGIARGLRSFRGLPHRLEPVVERDGVLWVNDSKATNVASARVALRSLDRPIVLLLGGRHKGEPYTELLPLIRERVRAVVAFGEAAERIQSDLGEHCRVERVEGDFAAVLRHAAALAEPGDAVLLAPACSSYDMFQNYEERGTRFRTLAREEIG